MGLKEEFEEYAEKAKTLPDSTNNESKLILYGLYKQATVRPVNTSRPGMFNMRDRAKWDAWKAVEGKSKDEAMSDYHQGETVVGRSYCICLISRTCCVSS